MTEGTGADDREDWRGWLRVRGWRTRETLTCAAFVGVSGVVGQTLAGVGAHGVDTARVRTARVLGAFVNICTGRTASVNRHKIRAG